MKIFIRFTCPMIFSLLFGLLSPLSAETIIPGGYVSGVWTVAGAPYLIQGDITIHADSTLNIEPGVEVNFQGFYSLTVNGFLEAVGTEADSIHFFSDSALGWNSLRFGDAPDSSHLAFCTISQSGNPYGGMGGLICTNSNPVISHCRISDNEVRGGFADLAGGIALKNSNPEISWCDISHNISGTNGGGINIYNSNPVITGCTINDNETIEQGGGIYIAGTSIPTITNCTIRGNLSNWEGGGILIMGGVVTISGCTIGDNEAYQWGGGVWINSGDISLYHCIIDHNVCPNYGGQGGGVFATGGALIVDRCTFYANYVNYEVCDGMDLHFEGDATATVTNNTFSNDMLLIYSASTSPISVSYNNFLYLVGPFCGNIPAGLGVLTATNTNGDSCDVYHNISLDPLFVNAPAGDYHLTAASPCIDAGDPNSPYDPDNTIADIGCFYYDQISDVDADLADLRPDKAPLMQNYPNPFNPVTVIEFYLPRRSMVNISVYNLLGQEVSRLIDDEFPAGNHRITWDGYTNSGLRAATGVYFYRIVADGFSATKKMLLLK